MSEELPLERVEELVEESVFHPSPCKRHRETVLKNAVRATVRQKISRRMLAAASGGVVMLGLAIVVIRMASSSGEAVPAPVEPASAATVESATAKPSAPAGSVGEGLFRSADPPENHGAANSGL